MRQLISLIIISEQRNLISLITYEPNLKNNNIQTKAVRKSIGIRKHMKPTPPQKLYLKVLPFNTLCIPFESEQSWIYLLHFVNRSKHTLPYSTLLQINNCLLSSSKPPNVPLLLNSAMILTNTSSTIPSLDVLIASNMVNIVRWVGGGTSESGCHICFIPSKIWCWNIDQKRRKVSENSWIIKTTFKYYFGGGRFHMLLKSYKRSRCLFLNSFLQVWLLGNQWY